MSIRSGPECFTQKLESYCDDINVVTNNLDDFFAVDEGVRKFESVSGAILSRDKKCQIIGLGLWKSRNSWPLAYLQPVTELKVFGIILTNSFRQLMKKNWDLRTSKFEKCVASWSSRHFKSLTQRVEILKVFALSRVFYVASIIPMTKTVVNQIEKIVGKFLWRSTGKILRIPLDEIKNPVEKGGLGLLCISAMSKSLLISQLLRLLKSGYGRSLRHVGYWIGEILNEFHDSFNDMTHSQDALGLYSVLAEIMTDLKLSEVISVSNWRKLTNKNIYNSYTVEFPVPKVERDAGVTLSHIWKKLLSPSLQSESKEVLYLSIHNKLPVRERLFRIGIVNDPYCEECLEETGAVISDVLHVFCQCMKVQDIWKLIRTIINGLLPVSLKDVEDVQLLSLNFRKSAKDDEITWLISTYVAEVWNLLEKKKVRQVSRDKLFGFLKFKYRADQAGARPRLQISELA